MTRFIRTIYPEIYFAHLEPKLKFRIDTQTTINRVGQDTVKAFEEPVEAGLDFEKVSELWTNLTTIIKNSRISSQFKLGLFNINSVLDKKSDVWINLIELADDFMSYTHLYPQYSLNRQQAQNLLDDIMSSSLLSEKQNFNFIIDKML